MKTIIPGDDIQLLFFVFVMKFVMICHYNLISMPVSLYITNSWYATVKYNRQVMSFLTDISVH